MADRKDRITIEQVMRDGKVVTRIDVVLSMWSVDNAATLMSFFVGKMGFVIADTYTTDDAHGVILEWEV